MTRKQILAVVLCIGAGLLLGQLAVRLFLNSMLARSFVRTAAGQYL